MLEAFAELLWDGAWRIAVLSALLGALLWGWFAFTLSSVQSFYFPAYVASSLHIVNGPEPDQIAWLVKTKPKKEMDIADAGDVTPATQGAVPFVLSPQAMQQGWTGVRVLRLAAYQAGSQQPFLQNSFFGGRSLGSLLLPPMEVLALPLFLWGSFVRWRAKREREPSWVWVNGEWVDELPSWASDVKDFSRELATAGASIARAGGRSLVQSGRKAVSKWRERGSVSPSVAGRQIEPAVNSAPMELAAAPSRQPLAEVRSPSPVALPPIQAEEMAPPKLSRAQTLPFRKRQAAEPAETDSPNERGDAR